MEMNDKAQLSTLEGFVAASMMVLAVMLVTKSSLIVSPQSELTMDVQLRQMANDALEVLDTAPATALPLNLTRHVARWNMNNATPLSPSLPYLNKSIGKLLDNVVYNVDLSYVDNGSIKVKPVIINGAPVENSVVATRLVTLYNSTVTEANGTWPIPDGIQVVEVRLIAWRV
jgi:hypothetical protein